MISVALNWTLRLILGGALIVAGHFKLQDNSALLETVAYIYWLPNSFKSVITDLLPWLEILLGFLLISKKLDNVALPFTAGIHLVFLLFAIYGFSTGIEGDCGWFGEAGGDGRLGSLLGSSLRWTMAIRTPLSLVQATVLLLE